MMSELELRNWLEMERERLCVLVDPSERKFCEYCICVLGGILGD